MILVEKIKCDDGGMPGRVERLTQIRQTYVDGLKKDSGSELEGTNVNDLITSLNKFPVADPMPVSLMEAAQKTEFGTDEKVPIEVQQTEFKSVLTKIMQILGLRRK